MFNLSITKSSNKQRQQMHCQRLTLAAILAFQCAAASGQNATSDEKLPLHGLTGGTSLGVYPALDKGLLITPGAHPATVSVPIGRIIQNADVAARIEGQDTARGKYQGIIVSATNKSDRPVVFDGDAAVASSAAGALPCVSLAKLEELSILPEQSKNFGKKFATDVKATTAAAVTVGWYQTIRDQKKFTGPVVDASGGRYGLDEQRRQDQLRRFGKRVLWPGDTTSGVIYFESGKPLSGVTIDMPVSSYYDPEDHSKVVVHN